MGGLLLYSTGCESTGANSLFTTVTDHILYVFFVFVFLQPGSSLEQTHIFVLAHILRRPIIVYGVKYYKSFRGETLGYTRFQGKFTL